MAGSGAALRTRDYIPELDGLRGVAIAMVLWVHLGVTHDVPSFQGGDAGVKLFFVLSGFLITRILLHSRNNGGGFLPFYGRRAARILPAYAVLLAVVLALDGYSREWLHAAVYVSNFMPTLGVLGHTWSLSVEEHFYLAWPLLVLFLPEAVSRRVVIYGLFVWLIGVVAAETWWMHEYGRPLHGKWTPVVMVGLMLGSLVAYFETFVRNARLGWTLGFALIVGASVVHWMLRSPGAAMGLVTETGRFVLWESMVMTGVLLIVLSQQSPTLSAAMRSSGLVHLGKISYGVYLYHIPIYTLCGLPGSPGLPGVVAGISLSLVAAWLSYHYLERPILDFRWPTPRSAFRLAAR